MLILHDYPKNDQLQSLFPLPVKSSLNIKTFKGDFPYLTHRRKHVSSTQPENAEQATLA